MRMKRIEKITSEKKSEDSVELVQALENSIRIMARMMMKAMTEWGIMAAVLILGALLSLTLRRRNVHRP